MDGELTLAGVDWRVLTPVRLVNVLAVLFEREVLVEPRMGEARDLFRSLLDPESESPEGPGRGLDDSGLPIGIRESPAGMTGG